MSFKTTISTDFYSHASQDFSELVLTLGFNGLASDNNLALTITQEIYFIT